MKSLNNALILFVLFFVVISGCKSDSSNPTSPTDSTKPTVSISTPTNNSTVTDSVLISVNATDNVGIEKVEFYIDGNLMNTRSAVPWQYMWIVRDLPSNSVHTILAKAYDATNNIASSTTINVTVNRTVQALQLIGTTEYISLPSSSSLTSFGNQITVEAWIKLNSFSIGQHIISSGNENEYAFAVSQTGKLAVTMAIPNPQVNHEFFSKSALLLDVWYHVAFSYNGVTESILINGVVDTSFTTSGNVSTSQYQENITIGAYTWNNYTNHSGFFHGMIDEVRIWNTSRTQAQIKAAMNSELSGSETGIVGYWKINGNVLDSSPNINHGTIVGNPTFISTIR